MSFCRSFSVPFTSAADGTVTARTGERVNGRVLEIRYVYGDALTGADLTITGAESGKAILTVTNAGTSSVTWQPRQVVHTVAETGAGAAVTYDGVNEIYEPIWIADEEIKVAVSGAGAAKTGTLVFIVG